MLQAKSKILLVLTTAIGAAVALSGCGKADGMNAKVDKVLEETKAYISECNMDDFYHVCDLIEENEIIQVSCDNGELNPETKEGSALSEEEQDELIGFFEEYPDISSIYDYDENGISFWYSPRESSIIISENDEPDISSDPPYDYIRNEENGIIYWVSDHRDDHESYYRSMYYEIGLQKVDETLWIKYRYEKFPWYSSLIG